MQKFIAILPDALIVSGGAAISFGAWMLHPAAGFIIGGALAVAGGVQAASKVAVKAAE